MQAKQILARALDAFFGEAGFNRPAKLVIEAPKDARHGDLSTNAALLLAREAGESPRQLALRIAQRIMELCPQVEKAEVAGPGFCNVTFRPEFWQSVVHDVERAGASYGHSASVNGRRALVEYVSANPTGPLHVGHGRGAAVGDSVARLLRAAGHEVATEYYLNDAGRQMRTLGLSIWLRALELSGKDITFPEDCYQGGYIRDLAAELLEKDPRLVELPESEGINICRQYGMERILAGIKHDLERFRCEHQLFFSEKSLMDGGAVASALTALEKSGRSYHEDGALWFETKSLGDDRNRVLRKSDGSLTYFASDIAYHHNKFARGFNWLIDVWGADHHGYIPRMRAAIMDMGENPENFDVLLIQNVNLLRNGMVVPMSTRAGEYVSLEDVINEVGVDAARFMFLSRSCDSMLDFDLELAKSRSLDNPVYYVQYAHARVCALLRRAADRNIEIADASSPETVALLDTPEDMAILRQIAAFEDTVANAAAALAPHHISRYLLDLSAKLHSYYGKYTIISPDDIPRTLARLALLRAAGQVLHNGLFLLGVEAPETM